jgi:hypothetical protein
MPQPQKKKPTKPKPASQRAFGWLGRQLGHVKKAMQTDVTKPARPAAKRKPAPTSAQKPKPAAKPTVVYRDNKVEEAELPNQPGVKLRRTIIDEVIVDPNKRMK